MTVVRFGLGELGRFSKNELHGHPNDEGYRRIAERLEKVLRPLLPRLRETMGPNQPRQMR